MVPVGILPGEGFQVLQIAFLDGPFDDERALE